MSTNQIISITSKGIPCNDFEYFKSKGLTAPIKPYVWVKKPKIKNCK